VVWRFDSSYAAIVPEVELRLGVRDLLWGSFRATGRRVTLVDRPRRRLHSRPSAAC